VASRLILQYDVQGVDDSRNVTQDCQQDVDQKVSAATTLKEDTERWEEDGEDDLADVASSERHFEVLVFW